MWRMTSMTMLVTTLLVGVLLASGVALAVTRVGGPGDNSLMGTNGADRLSGRAGDDRISGLGGDDPRLVGGFGDDTISGGRGDDRILGHGLVRGGGGAPNYERGSDALWGGAGDDHLVGGLGPDRLGGGRGDDSLLDALGEYGADRSTDILSGGRGNDEILPLSQAGRRDLISCGGGFDRVAADRGIDIVAGDCEDVSYRLEG